MHWNVGKYSDLIICSCPPSTPLLALRTEAGMLDMEQRVWLEKLFIAARLLHTTEEQENVCREVLEEQLLQGWPGLIKEVQEIFETVGLPDVTRNYINRKEVVQLVEFYCMKMAKEKMVVKEKFQHILNKDCRKMQQYMKIKSLKQS